MQLKLLEILTCPVTRSRLSMQVIKHGPVPGAEGSPAIAEAILFAETGSFYPVIKGIPRLCVESFLDHAPFLELHLQDYAARKQKLLDDQWPLISHVLKKNKRTRQSFSKEWSIHQLETDKTWDANDEEMVERFLKE